MGKKKEQETSEKSGRAITIPKRGCGGVLAIYLFGIVCGMISMARIQSYFPHQEKLGPYRIHRTYLSAPLPLEIRYQHEPRPSRIARLLATYYQQHLRERHPQTAQTQPLNDLEKIVEPYTRHKPSD